MKVRCFISWSWVQNISNQIATRGHGDKHLQMFSKFNVGDHFLGIDIAGLWDVQIFFVWGKLLKCLLPLKKEFLATFSYPPFRYWYLQDSLVVRTTVNGRQPQSSGCWISKQSKTAAFFLKIIDPIRWPLHHMYEKTRCHDCTNCATK